MGDHSLVETWTTWDKGVFFKELWSYAHIYGMFCIFDQYFWNIPSVFSTWISNTPYFLIFLLFLLWNIKWDITLFSCYELFHSINIQWQCSTWISFVFQVDSSYWQASTRYNFSTRHDIFPGLPNLVSQLNNVNMDPIFYCTPFSSGTPITPLGLPLDSWWINSLRKKILWIFGMDIYAGISKARETQEALEILKLELADHAWNQPTKLKWDGIPH